MGSAERRNVLRMCLAGSFADAAGLGVLGRRRSLLLGAEGISLLTTVAVEA